MLIRNIAGLGAVDFDQLKCDDMTTCVQTRERVPEFLPWDAGIIDATTYEEVPGSGVFPPASLPIEPIQRDPGYGVTTTQEPANIITLQPVPVDTPAEAKPDKIGIALLAAMGVVIGTAKNKQNLSAGIYIALTAALYYHKKR